MASSNPEASLDLRTTITDETLDPDQRRPSDCTISCNNCERTIGDSSFWLSSCRELNAVTFEYLSSITLSENIQFVEGGSYDEYSTYRAIICEKCSAILGKYYVATPPKLTGLVDRYTLSCEALKIYTFRKKAGSLSVAEDRAIAALLHPQPDEQINQMIKIQSFCVVLSDQLALLRQENVDLKERIARLENQMEGRSQNEHASNHHNMTTSISEAAADSTTFAGNLNPLNGGQSQVQMNQQQHLRYDGPPDEFTRSTTSRPSTTNQEQQKHTASPPILSPKLSIRISSSPQPEPKPKQMPGVRGRKPRLSGRLSNVSDIRDSADETTPSVDEYRFEASVSADESGPLDHSMKNTSAPAKRGRKKRIPIGEETSNANEASGKEDSRRHSASGAGATATASVDGEGRNKRPRFSK